MTASALTKRNWLKSLKEANRSPERTSRSRSHDDAEAYFLTIIGLADSAMATHSKSTQAGDKELISQIEALLFLLGRRIAAHTLIRH